MKALLIQLSFSSSLRYYPLLAKESKSNQLLPVSELLSQTKNTSLKELKRMCTDAAFFQTYNSAPQTSNEYITIRP